MLGGCNSQRNSEFLFGINKDLTRQFDDRSIFNQRIIVGSRYFSCIGQMNYPWQYNFFICIIDF